MRRPTFVLVACVPIACVLAACSTRGSVIELPDAAPFDGGPELDAGPELPDAGPESAISIDRVVPDHGPFAGGAVVTLRGSGFAMGAHVRFAGIDAPAVTFVDEHRLTVLTPPGAPGLADVEVELEEERALREDAYAYEAIRVEPAQGSVAGGTRLSIEGWTTHFAAGARVLVGPHECAGVRVDDEEHLGCVVPAGALGTVDVRVEQEGAEPLVARAAFTYVDGTDRSLGGFHGGPIAGEVTVHVRNASCRSEPVEGARVVIEGGLAGTTDASGDVVLSDAALRGPVTVHVGRRCFASVSVAGVDAREITVPLEGNDACAARRACADDPFAGVSIDPPLPAVVRGRLRFPGPSEFGRNPWMGVPQPGEGEERVAYVLRSTGRVPGDLLDVETTSPEHAPPNARESDTDEAGYPYALLVTPGALSLGALAGILDAEGHFRAYVMGIRRGVHALPGEEVDGGDIEMSILLDGEVRLARPADSEPFAAHGPDRWSARAWIDVGATGVLWRGVIEGDPAMRGTSSEQALTLTSMPRAELLPAFARLHTALVAHSGEDESAPLAARAATLDPRAAATIEVPAQLGVPRLARASGTRWPEDGLLAWSRVGAEPTVTVITVREGDRVLARVFVRGDRSEARVPDERVDAMLPALPRGPVLIELEPLAFGERQLEELDWGELVWRAGWTARAEAHAWLLR